MAKREKNLRPTTADSPAIGEITVAGFKSISDEQSIEIRPLTILAGANSSGKSSLMQAVLLLKQTLEAPYDPGCLLLNGPNVKFTTAEQLLSRINKRSWDEFRVGLRLTTGEHFESTFRKKDKSGFRIEQMKFGAKDKETLLWPDMSEAEISKSGVTRSFKAPSREDLSEPFKNAGGKWAIGPNRCFLELQWLFQTAGPSRAHTSARENVAKTWTDLIPRIVHLPGLRGNPERTYAASAVGPTFPGTFEKYTASLISRWADERNGPLDRVNKDLRLLGLTGGVKALQLNDVQIEVYVGRLPGIEPTSPENRVNIADVGIGVSQCLPVVVALHSAQPGQLVYIEQPETHLHPRAQFALAQLLGAAAKRGVRVVVETHSSILLLGVQLLVAESKLPNDAVKLHWFQRPDGHSVVTSRDLDEAGRFGDWPEDFDEVALQTQREYLDAAEKHLFAK